MSLYFVRLEQAPDEERHEYIHAYMVFPSAEDVPVPPLAKPPRKQSRGEGSVTVTQTAPGEANRT